jgi:hypothetical protein
MRNHAEVGDTGGVISSGRRVDLIPELAGA